MNNSKAEQERKVLNKKLLKDTFKSEMNEKKKYQATISDFVFLFIALCLADLFIKLIKIDYWLIEILIATIILMILNFVRDKIITKVNK